jgi:hypothetical protein
MVCQNTVGPSFWDGDDDQDHKIDFGSTLMDNSKQTRGIQAAVVAGGTFAV